MEDFRKVLFQLIKDEYLEEYFNKNRIELRVVNPDVEKPFMVEVRKHKQFSLIQEETVID